MGGIQAYGGLGKLQEGAANGMASISRNSVRPWPEVAQAMPKLSAEERQALADSISKTGVQIPVLVLPDGRIIDGHHRWEISGGDCPVEVLDIGEGDAEDLALTLNIARRNLSPEQIFEARLRKRELRVARMQKAIELLADGAKQKEVAEVIGVSQPTISDWKNGDGNNIGSKIPDIVSGGSLDQRVKIPKSAYLEIYDRAISGESLEEIASDFKATSKRIGQIVAIMERRRNGTPERDGAPSFPAGTFRCIVIDPPWPVQKIEREERPNQGPKLDYPILSVEEITNYKSPDGRSIPDLADKDGCHLYLWVTHRFLLDGLRILEAWGFTYQCLMTWVKPTGFTPFSWMYNTEHVLFAKKGGLALERNGLKLSFEAKVAGHSKKPDVFFERVVQASPERRVELFARKAREGFFCWGNEVSDGRQLA